MVNKKFWLGILVLVLVFGMTVVGCDNGSTDDSKNDSFLNGTWKLSNPDHPDGEFFELTMDEGKWEVAGLDGPGLVLKGTYTLSGNTITFLTTHYYGGAADVLPESKWYTRFELMPYFTEEYLDYMFGLFDTGTYSKSNDILSLWGISLIKK